MSIRLTLDTVRLVVLVVQVIALPALAIRWAALYRQALDACNAERSSRQVPPLPDDTLLNRSTQRFILYGVKMSTLGPEARRRVRLLRLFPWVWAGSLIMLAVNLFLR